MLSKLGRMIVPDTETFRSNTQGTYNIIEASCKLGIPNIVIASNTAVYSVSFAQGDADYTSFPIEEDQHIYTLRIGQYNVDVFYSYVPEPGLWKVHGWSYTDSRDLGGMCEAPIQTLGLGCQVFNATSDTITNCRKMETFLREKYPNTPITREMGEFEAPLSNAKVQRRLGFPGETSKKYFRPWDATGKNQKVN
ncbi:Nascent polypeptide-associated complex NAC [Penicillium atrosanguineum]|uniref:Nascent polypeptide-associated complex NAC n=1 Tax=Penicillium atrosanguineum TaxID=1132637 RepID=A0A9W9U720_9EURO|nr:Nascent polypeptide-associated complex NAC [Penicillium atrosanguineum]KAJ5321474.1 Nascent polypeptide-associated complex NAC [Penicillium atrosanguineum]